MEALVLVALEGRQVKPAALAVALESGCRVSWALPLGMALEAAAAAVVYRTLMCRRRVALVALALSPLVFHWERELVEY